MFIKKLIIKNPERIIKEIEFKTGLNLIIDNTPADKIKNTGNNVGKTTVLKLIDVCLGKKPSIVYEDTENKKETYDLVKDYLIDKEVDITLILAEDLNDPSSKEIVLQRNFLARNKAIRKINKEDVLEQDYENQLLKLLFPNQKFAKPTFKQIISHNIRYRDEGINNTLKTLNEYTSDAEYETLYLFLLGCESKQGAKKQDLLTKIKQEENFKVRLQRKETKNAYEIALSLIEDDILELNEKKSSFNLNKEFEEDLEKLNTIKYGINKTSSLISTMNIRKNLIEESKREIEQSVTSIDLQQLQNLYTEAKFNIEGIQKTFSDLVAYHNRMLGEKAKFITADLPPLIDKLKAKEREMNILLEQENVLSKKIARGDSFEDLEKIIIALNDNYRRKGEYEIIISQLDEVNNNIEDLNDELKSINDLLFSDNFEERLKIQIKKFNKYFSAISEELYDEKYLLKYEKTTKNSKPLYKFSAFNANMSPGKKQGEMLCFDLAYILFVEQENIPYLHFLLNDKKELMHGNQLIKVAEFVQNKNIQLVISILKDKLPEVILKNAHIAVELSQERKLFRIEEAKK